VAIERGSLVIADISGYSSYLTGSELDHAHDVLADLLDTIAREASPLLTMSKLEGDAIFWYRFGEPTAGAVFPTLEASYAAFRRRLRTIEYETTCRCNACRLIPELDLKVLAHQGEFVVRDIAGVRELVGTDVVLIHRMLKNHVAERLGTRAYAMLTKPFATAVGVATGGEWLEHVEAFEDVGEVTSLVCDLGARWRAAEERTPVFVSADAKHRLELDLPAPPAIVWEWLTAPDLRARWEPNTQRVEQTNVDGVPGVGSRNHCVHGRSANDEDILDWRPFHYSTISSRIGGATFLFTAELTEVDAGRSHLSWRAGPGATARDRLTLRLMWPMLRRWMASAITNLEPLLAEAAASPEDREDVAIG
jgi:uncharacterized protein YndB with AHSA1/START domain